MPGPIDYFSFDKDYVERLIAGDEATQRHFIDYFTVLLRLKLRGRVRPPELADEAVQETFLRVFKALRQNGIEHPERLGAYVHSVAGHVAQEFYRAESRTAPLPEYCNPADGRVDLEAGLISRESQAAVHLLLEELPERERTLLRAVFIEEQNKDLVCARLGVDRGYLRVLVHRAKQRFVALKDGRPRAAAAGR